MKSNLLIIYLFTLISCNNQPVRAQEQKDIVAITAKDTFERIPDCTPSDTITDSGINIRYLYNNGEYQISWGNAVFHRVLDSVYTCTKDEYGGIWDFIPKLEWETQNNLIFKNVLSTSGGANPAPIEFTAFILPKNAIDTVLELPFYIQSIGNYLFYADAFTTQTLFLLNIETKQLQEIVLNPPAAVGRTIAFALKKISIKNRNLLITYEALRKDDEIYVEKFKVTIRV